MSFTEILNKLVEGENLTSDEAETALTLIITGVVPESQIAAFLFGMRAKGETVEEMTSFVKVMRNAAVKVDVDIRHAVDLCGTGGDQANTFNISTAAMFVVAGAGVPVLKHGNRSVSSQSGSADVLEALGSVAALRKNEVEKVYKETGLAFMFAPYFHPAMKEVIPVRGALKMRTFFNILGPLLNPAGVRRQIVGAYDREIAGMIIRILSNLDTEFAFGINAHDGLDEFSITGATEIFELNDGKLAESISFDPTRLGFSIAKPEELKGGDRHENASIIRSIMEGRSAQAQRDIVLLNALFAIRASGKVKSLEEARESALDSLNSGKALQKLEMFITATNDIAQSK